MVDFVDHLLLHSCRPCSSLVSWCFSCACGGVVVAVKQLPHLAHAASEDSTACLPRDSPAPEAASQAWQEILVVVGKLMECFSQASIEIATPVWKAVLFLCRRMVEVLGDAVLNSLDAMLHWLCTRSDRAGLSDLLVLAQHLVSQFRPQKPMRKCNLAHPKVLGQRVAQMIHLKLP